MKAKEILKIELDTATEKFLLDHHEDGSGAANKGWFANKGWHNAKAESKGWYANKAK